MGKSKYVISNSQKIKDAFSKLKLDLVKADVEVIKDVIVETVGEEEWKKHEEEVQKILNARDLNRNFSFKNCYVMALGNNADSWKTMTKTVKIQGKYGKKLEVSVSVTPAAELGVFTHLSANQGVSSNERESPHAINMWKSEVKSKSGEVLFSGIRHGNTRGKVSSSQEIILAAAVQQYGLEKLQESDPNHVWVVRLGNVQLMSPTRIPIASVDYDLPFKQAETFEELSKKPSFKVQIVGKDGAPKWITLKLEKPVLFNFGVNSIYYSLKGKMIKSFDSRNEKGLITLFGEKIIKEGYDSKKGIELKNIQGDVGEYLVKLEVALKKEKDEKEKQKILIKKKKIINLSKQILNIWFETQKHGRSVNPAAIQTRLSGLMFLIGYPVSFNCKSGKDRTGEVSAEINDLMTTMEANDGEPPDPYEKLSDSQKVQASEMFDASLGEQITQSNTGYRGLKVGYKPITDRMGKMKGTSKHAKG